MKYCVDCKHYRFHHNPFVNKCWRNGTNHNLVNGKENPTHALNVNVERYPEEYEQDPNWFLRLFGYKKKQEDRCGTEGKYFEPKNRNQK